MRGIRAPKPCSHHHPAVQGGILVIGCPVEPTGAEALLVPRAPSRSWNSAIKMLLLLSLLNPLRRASAGPSLLQGVMGRVCQCVIMPLPERLLCS